MIEVDNLSKRYKRYANRWARLGEWVSGGRWTPYESRWVLRGVSFSVAAGEAVGVVLQFWFWLTPIVYSTAILPERAQAALTWNPMARIVAAYQQLLVAGVWPQWSQFRLHAVGALIVLVVAFAVFDRLSGEMVDEL